MSSLVTVIVHGVVTVFLIVAYTTMSVLGHDATPLLGVLVGYIGGAAIAPTVAAAKSGSPPPSTSAKGS